ncbi:MAG: Rrf2 family transcriptional regulator [Sulfuriflexus sp.]|nr:Rrf2 family transcriptional regulator [Sulfuriflexus sp.]
MKLSSRSQYAITAMLELALHEASRPITLFDISQKQKISLSYLEQLFARLRKQKLVRGRRGPGGGYVLARDADDISVADIVAAVDDVPTDSNEDAISEDGVSSDILWHNLSSQIYNYLREIKLSQFLQQGSSTTENGAGAGSGTSSQGWKTEVSYHSRA